MQEPTVTARQRADWRAELPDEDGIKTGREKGQESQLRDRWGWYRRTAWRSKAQNRAQNRLEWERVTFHISESAQQGKQ